MTTRPAGAPPASLVNLNPDRWTQPFWDAAAQRRLVAQRCAQCKTFRMPPAPLCYACQSTEDEWVQLSGKGRVYTFTVVHHPVAPLFAEVVPYVVAVVELPDAGNVRLISNIVDSDPSRVSIGMPVEVVWDEVRPGVVVPRFRPSAMR